MRLALALLTWQISLESIGGKRESAAADLLHACVVHQPATNGQFLLAQLTKSFADNWRMLVILKVVAEEATSHISVADYGYFLATFVRLSAAVITQYLKLKNEHTMSNTDRVESDMQLDNNCEQWVT